MSINQYLINQSDDNFYHSSGYARVAHGQQLGSASSQSFASRSQIDKNRRVIRHYRHSMVANQASRPANKTDSTIVAQPKSSRPLKISSRQKTDTLPRSGTISYPPRTVSFKEPPSRSYNPLA